MIVHGGVIARIVLLLVVLGRSKNGVLVHHIVLRAMRFGVLSQQ
jgi:hypothetical protein